MRVLIVCSFNNNRISPFIEEQVDALKDIGVEIEYYLIRGKGMVGYLLNFSKLRRFINAFNPDLIHAHYSLSGLLAIMQKKRKVIVTFHGSDINNKKTYILSLITNKFANYSIFVSSTLSKKINAKRFDIIPCGVNMSTFYPVPKKIALNKMNLDTNAKYILFSSSFSNPVKNFNLAQKAIALVNNNNIKLLELRDYSREEVNILINASECVLLTSFSEGSPQIIKEALACNKPIVSTDVGDVRTLVKGLHGCFISSFNPSDVAEKIKLAIRINKTNSRNSIQHLSNERISQRIYEVYSTVIFR